MKAGLPSVPTSHSRALLTVLMLQPEVTSSMKAGLPSVPRSHRREHFTALGTTFPYKDPETRNKDLSSHVAKAVCHGNIREGLVGRLLQLLRAWF